MLRTKSEDISIANPYVYANPCTPWARKAWTLTDYSFVLGKFKLILLRVLLDTQIKKNVKSLILTAYTYMVGALVSHQEPAVHQFNLQADILTFC